MPLVVVGSSDYDDELKDKSRDPSDPAPKKLATSVTVIQPSDTPSSCLALPSSIQERSTRTRNRRPHALLRQKPCSLHQRMGEFPKTARVLTLEPPNGTWLETSYSVAGQLHRMI